MQTFDQVAARAYNLMGGPTNISVNSVTMHEQVIAVVQAMIEFARQSNHPWLTKRLPATIDGSGSGEYRINVPDYAGLWDIFYNREMYPTYREFPTISVVDASDLRNYETGTTYYNYQGFPTAIQAVATRYDANLQTELLIVRPIGAYAEVVLEYVPGAFDDAAPDDVAQIIPSFTATLLPTWVAFNLIDLADWRDMDPRRAEILRSERKKTLGLNLEIYREQYDKHLFKPVQTPKVVRARPFNVRGRR